MTTVLVLDDRPSDRQLMATLLGYAGHDVLEAATGEAALELARANRPQLIVADILMPGMNGYEFVRRLREDPAIGATPVIFCTANYLEAEVGELARSCGVSRFISKPYAAGSALATIAAALSERPPDRGRRPGPEFEREQLRVVNDKLAEKIGELELVGAHRRRLLGLVMSAQRDERRRIADGIHDDSLQTVLAVGLWLEVLGPSVVGPEGLEALDRSKLAVASASEGLRTLLFELRPAELERRGLVAALRTYLEQVEREDGLRFVLDARLPCEPEHEMRALLYQAARELLMNVRKHSRARRVDVTLATLGERHILRVSDDGVGFDIADALRARPGHLGLAALAETIGLAGGLLRVESPAAGGATVEADVPLRAA